VCNLIFVSTDNPQDLSTVKSDQFSFHRPTDEDLEMIGEFLRYPNRWYLQCQYGGCSCHFRHLGAGSDFHFGPPDEWFEEDEDDLAATAAAYDLLANLVAQGHKVDVLDTWNAEISNPLEVAVNLEEVTRTDFRFWEGCRFELTRP
jgi:hypothetical protein